MNSELQKMLDKFSEWGLSRKAWDVLASCDQGGLEMFKDCESREDVEQLVADITADD